MVNSFVKSLILSFSSVGMIEYSNVKLRMHCFTSESQVRIEVFELADIMLLAQLSGVFGPGVLVKEPPFVKW